MSLRTLLHHVISEVLCNLSIPHSLRKIGGVYTPGSVLRKLVDFAQFRCILNPLVRMKRPAPDSQFVGYAVNRVETQRRATSERSRFMKRVRFVGLDVHAETIAVAVAETDGEVRSLGVIPNRVESIRKLVKKLGPAEQLRVCYEAGPTG